MKNNVSRRAAAAFAVLCLSACAHNPAPPPAKSITAGPQSSQSASITNLPPDVLATCQHITVEATAGHIADAARVANECLASHSLPVAVRVGVLQQLTFLDMALHDDRAALDTQLAAIELTPKPTDLQLLLLSRLYRSNQRNDESLETLNRVRDAHEVAHDMDRVLGMPYYQELGSTLAAMGRHHEAIDAFTKGIPLEPALADAYRRRAIEREATGDTTGARADYVRFARWEIDRNIDVPTRAKLTSLGIDPASERRYPFGDTNPLHAVAVQQLENAQQALKSAATTQAKAEAYSNISIFSDGLDRNAQALTAIDEAIALAPDTTSYKQSKVTTLVGLNHIDAAIALAAPMRKQVRDEAAMSATPSAVYGKYVEVSGSAALAYMQQKNWADAIEALVDTARGSAAFDQDYMASLYLYVRARSAGAAPVNAYFEDYIRRASQPVFGNYRRWLLLYLQGRVTIDQVYVQVISIGNTVAIQNALAETWFMAAGYERYVKHNDAAARAYVERLNDLQPYGTNEWMMAKRGGV
jgi:tetratricopeptide (TPR) repeat protein